jgi:GABA(A) receptor-associated protein
MDELKLKPGDAERLRDKFPGRLPIFVTKSSNTHDIPDIPKKKYLAPSNLTVGQFIYIIRRQIKLPAEKALFLFVNNTLPTSNSTLAEIYSLHKSSDGALHMIYTSESTFG